MVGPAKQCRDMAAPERRVASFACDGGHFY
jgi:hypothetical protein